MHFIIEFSNGIVQLSSVYNICAIKSMIVLEMKCPQLSKPEATVRSLPLWWQVTILKSGEQENMRMGGEREGEVLLWKFYTTVIYAVNTL